MKPLRAKYFFSVFAFIFAAVAILPLAAQPASPHEQAIADLLSELSRTRVPRQAAISPDGNTVAWIATSGKAGNRVFLRAFDGAAGSEHPISISTRNAVCNEQDIAWAPDGKRIAFTSDCETPGQQQIFIAEVTAEGRAGTPQLLTHVKGFVHRLAWSSGSNQLGFLYVANATRPPNATSAIKPLVGVINTATIAEIQRIAIISVPASIHGSALPAIKEVTPEDLHVYEFSWSPDGKQVAYVAAAPPGEDNWWVAQLYTQAIAGSTPHSLLQPKLQIAVPRWSPDGKQIAFIQGLMSDAGQVGGDIYLIPAAGGEARNLTSARKASPAWLHWLKQDQLGFTEVADGAVRFSEINTQTGQEDTAARTSFTGRAQDGIEMLSLSLSHTPSPRIALIQSSFDTPPEVWAGPLGHLQQITHYNTELKPDWGKSESVTWENDGFHVQGWLLYPKDYNPAQKYPMILWIHGGPANMTLPGWPGVGYGPAAFSTAGYFVLMPNPRGSFGEGETFTEANRKDFGYGDLRDLLAGVDIVSKKYSVDPNRVGITGWSYGGFMTMFAITQTHRFRAAVAAAGISDWKSYYGENSIDQWMIPYFGDSVYADPAIYAKSSAINFIRNAKTPTLIVVGDRDGECPAPQSFEMWHALRAMHVPVKLVVYANEGHSFAIPGDYQDVLERALAWFEEYMPSSPGAAKQPSHSR